MAGGCVGDLRHYAVTSPDWEEYRYEPPDYWWEQCWVVVLAESHAKARAAALRTEEFAPWRRRCRGDLPYRGMSVRLSRCPHGRCLSCHEDDLDEEWLGCDVCRDEWERECALAALAGV